MIGCLFGSCFFGSWFFLKKIISSINRNNPRTPATPSSLCKEIAPAPCTKSLRMPNKWIISLFLGCLLSTAGSAQVVIFINAGSRANHGQLQELFIEQNGNCRYRLSVVNGAVKDSASFSLSATQMDSIFRKANETGFFSLNNKYDGGKADGAGIYISLNHSGRKHAVELLNIDQPAVNQLVTLLNTILAPRNIRINYGQFITPRPR